MCVWEREGGREARAREKEWSCSAWFHAWTLVDFGCATRWTVQGQLQTLMDMLKLQEAPTTKDKALDKALDDKALDAPVEQTLKSSCPWGNGVGATGKGETGEGGEQGRGGGGRAGLGVQKKQNELVDKENCAFSGGTVASPTVEKVCADVQASMPVRVILCVLVYACLCACMHVSQHASMYLCMHTYHTHTPSYTHAHTHTHTHTHAPCLPLGFVSFQITNGCFY